ncbi:MAG TPA: nucleotidyltransferase family protein [Chloroflexota bacterium]|nr:nucleotidyltransferase family protein [Chloroflexota bacterium]
MEALILAAGYATRLGELTQHRAKPLLPVGPKPMIDYIFCQLAEMPEVCRVNVVTNQKFAAQFHEWAAGHGSRPAISVINDGTASDADKLGAVGDIRLALRRNRIDDDLLVVAGDNLFDFPLQQFVAFFHSHGSSVGLYDTGDLEIMKQYAVVELDPFDERVTDFVEKPREPRSTLAATCIYLWRREHLALVERYGGNLDAPGHFVQWLTKEVDVYGFRIPGEWRDIGTPEQYAGACRQYASARPSAPVAG